MRDSWSSLVDNDEKHEMTTSVDVISNFPRSLLHLQIPALEYYRRSGLEIPAGVERPP